MSKRRKFSDELKAKVAVKAIKRHKTAKELAQEYDIISTRSLYRRSSFWK